MKAVVKKDRSANVAEKFTSTQSKATTERAKAHRYWRTMLMKTQDVL